MSSDKNRRRKHTKTYSFGCLSIHTDHRADSLENSTLDLYAKRVKYANPLHEDVMGDQFQGLPMESFEKRYYLSIGRPGCGFIRVQKEVSEP